MTNFNPETPLDLDQLADWLEDEQRAEDCFDIHGLHGFIAALVICGQPLDDGWLAAAVDQDLNQLPESDAIFLAESAVQLYQMIETELYSESHMSLTFEPTEQWQQSDMRSWCEGFMEIVFELPEIWSTPNEEQLSVLLLPIETASGFFEAEEDFKSIYRQPKLLQQMFQDIPELLTDLYLLFHSPAR